jgi:pyridine nucleotide-disulfide oxidoreductase
MRPLRSWLFVSLPCALPPTWPGPARNGSASGARRRRGRCELTQAFRRLGLGSEVTIVEMAARPPPAADPAAARVIAEAFGAEGIKVHAGTAVTT